MSALPLDDAKSHLNITAGTFDAELQGFIDAAEAAIAKKVGDLEPTTTTSRVAGGSALVLPVMPVISLTSITPINGSPLTLADYYLNADAGVVTQIWGGSFTSIAYDVVYMTGRTTCPDDLLLAVKELVRHMWETQRGGAQRPGSRPSEALSNTLPGAAYTFPIRVTELLVPHVRFGFA